MGFVSELVLVEYLAISEKRILYETGVVKTLAQILLGIRSLLGKTLGKSVILKIGLQLAL